MGSVVRSSVSARMTASTTSIGSSSSQQNQPSQQEANQTDDNQLQDEQSQAQGGGGEQQLNETSVTMDTRYWFPSVTEWYANLDKRNAATVAVLVYCNLINYMDRSTVAGLLDYIGNDEDFNKPDLKKQGLLQTAFVLFYTFTAPLFGYLGDRYPRKWIVGLGLSVWSAATLAGSFCTNFWLFMFFRAVVGVGEASYSTVAPAIISDLFVADTRSKVLALFYFAVPVGTGLGYMVGSEVGQAAQDR